MKTRWAIVFGVVCGLLAAGILTLVSHPPRGKAIDLLAPPTPPPVTVHVSGAVVNPGVYELPAGSRIQDAIRAAGGLLAEADDSALNLAAPLRDGQAMRVPAIGEQPPAVEPAQDSPIDLNTATQAMLESLPGIGPVLAQRILQYRQEHGGFVSVQELLQVEGLGAETFAKIEQLVTVTSAP